MPIKILFFIISTNIFVHFLLIDVKAINYCDTDVCNNSKQHTLCKFQEPARHCINLERTIKTAEEKRALLGKINSRRNKIAAGDIRSFPSAESMIKLEWNKELEKSAQRWADQCVSHSTPDSKDTCRDLIGGVPVGQNIATVYGEAPGLSPSSLVDVWYMELLNTNSSVIPRYKPSSQRGYSHYDYFTQLVWARSKEVGCGGVTFKEHLKGKNQNRTVNRLVCNFAPAGNVVGEPVYVIGPACTRCPAWAVCDNGHEALCSVKNRDSKQDSEFGAPDMITTPNLSININKNDFSEFAKREHKAVDDYGYTDSTKDMDDEIFTFDYLSHFTEYTRDPLTTATTANLKPCKDVLAVDEFVELIKKKLSNDPSFKESLTSAKNPLQPGYTDVTITDPNVAAFVKKVYSKKEPLTTIKLPDNEYVNSTLLVDLVEAVIFRSGEKTMSGTEALQEYKQHTPPVISPVKIQAELPEVKINNDFTGHYFFPEDIVEDSKTEMTDLYYDNSEVPVSDVVLEIENLKRDKTTKNFLDEIIESDFATENEEVNRFKRRNYHPGKRHYDIDIGNIQRLKKREMCTHNCDDYMINYSDLLRKLASDLKLLKLNDRFHCSRNYAVHHQQFQVLFISIFSNLLLIEILK